MTMNGRNPIYLALLKPGVIGGAIGTFDPDSVSNGGFSINGARADEYVVMVDGAVYNPTAITFRPGKNTEWYLRQAGGPTPMANRKEVFVIRANGSVAGGAGGIFDGGVLNTELRPGDLVMMPEKAVSGNSKWKTTLEASQLVYSIGVAIQVARSF